MEKFLNLILKVTIYLLVFLFPIFVLPFSFEVPEFSKNYLLFFFVSIAFFVWIARMVLVDKAIRLRWSLPDFFVLGFLLIAGLSTLFSIDKISSIFGFYGRFWPSLLGVLNLTVFYFLITNNTSVSSAPSRGPVISKPPLTLNGLLTAFFASVFLVVLASFFTIFGIWQKLSSILSLPAFMLQKVFNPAAGSLEGMVVFLTVAASLLVGLILINREGRKISFILSGLVLAGILGLLIMVNFWVAWVGLLSALALFLALSLWKRIFLERINWLIVPILLIFLAGFFLLTGIFSFKLVDPQSYFDLPGEVILSQKESWVAGTQTAVYDIKNAVLGSGIGTYFHDFARFKSPEFNMSGYWQIRFDRPHAHFAEILATMGFLGLFFYLSLIGAFLVVFWRILKIKPSRTKQNYGAEAKPSTPRPGKEFALLTAFLALFFLQIFYYQNMVLAFAFWLILALSVVSWQRFSGKLGKMNGEKIIFFRNYPELSLLLTSLLIGLGVVILSGYYLAARFYLADAFYRNALERAETSSLKKATELNPFQPQYKMALARFYLAEALTEMQKPADSQDQLKLANNIQLALTFAKGGILDGSFIQGATELAPNNVSVWALLATIYREIAPAVGGARNWQIQTLEKAISLEPLNPVFYSELGRAYSAQGDLEKAKENFAKAAQLKPDYSPALIQQTLLKEREGDTKTALKEMEGLAQQFPRDTEVLFQLGRLYFNDQQIDSAIFYLERAVVLSPNYSNALFALGLAYEAKGRKDLAVQVFEKLVELHPDNPDIAQKLKSLKKEEKEEK
jgi:Flp pilus assembly protein TadD